MILFHSNQKKINVAPGSDIRPLYEKAPFFINFKVHLFNVTNKEEVNEGSKLNH